MHRIFTMRALLILALDLQSLRVVQRIVLCAQLRVVSGVQAGEPGAVHGQSAGGVTG